MIHCVPKLNIAKAKVIKVEAVTTSFASASKSGIRNATRTGRVAAATLIPLLILKAIALFSFLPTFLPWVITGTRALVVEWVSLALVLPIVRGRA